MPIFGGVLAIGGTDDGQSKSLQSDMLAGGPSDRFLVDCGSFWLSVIVVCDRTPLN